MSTAQRELEELRKIREEAKQKALAEQLVEQEKQAKLAKKNEFLSRAALFQAKKGPSEEEVRQKIQKESTERKFGRQLNKMIAGGPKAHLNKEAESADEQDRPEGWKPPPPVKLFMPPPPPPKPMPAPPAPPSAPAIEELEADAYASEPTEEAVGEAAEEAYVFSGWVYVFENEASPYYWHMPTNATTFIAPPEYGGELYINGAVTLPAPAAEAETEEQLVVWQEVEDEEGHVLYLNTLDSSTSIHRPQGELYVVVQTEEGEGEESWLEELAEDGRVLYRSMASGVQVDYRPLGPAIITQHTHI